LALAAGALVLLLAAAVRIRSADNSLWLDEIWPIHQVSSLTAPWQVLTRIHSDANHYLNSLWLYVIGSKGNWAGYRAPSVLAGVGTVAVAGWIGRKRSPATGCFALLLTGFSYVLIVYSSEARGYATLTLFALLAYASLDRHLTTHRWGSAVLFSCSAALGLLSHLTFAGFLLAAFPWALLRLRRSRRPAKAIAASLAGCFAPPTVLLTVLYVVDLRFLDVNGGATPGLGRCVVESLAWTFGHPGGTVLAPLPLPTFTPALAAAAAVGLGLVAGIVYLARTDPVAIVVFGGTIVVAPVLLVVGSGSEVLYVRYFIVPILFLLLLFSFMLGALDASGRIGRILSGALLAGYLFSNGRQLPALFALGRGDNAGAIAYIRDHSRDRPITVTGDIDFRIGTVVNFFRATEPADRSLRYLTTMHFGGRGVEWLVGERESFEPPALPEREYVDAEGHRFAFVQAFPAAPLSGLHWFLYHNRAYDDAAGVPP
jgi:hypothetical protein